MMSVVIRSPGTSRVLLALVVAGVMGGFGSRLPGAESPPPPKFSEYCPAATGQIDSWSIATPSTAGLKQDYIDKLARDGRDNRLGNLHSVLVVKDGALVVEEYFRGAKRENCQLIASVTKSLVSVLVGMALERSPRHSVDSPLVDFFPQYADALEAKGTPSITLAHALTMTAGLEWDEYTFPHPDDRNPNTQMYRQSDPKHFILNRKLVHRPGGTWNYNSGLSVIAGATVRVMTGKSIDKFAEANLFAPLEITRYHWFRHADGTVYANGDLLLTPRDLAKIGLLVLNRGEWRGQQIVSRQWIEDSTRRIATAQGDLGYGYSWWLGTTIRAGRRFEIIFASGTGGQRLFIVPQLNMVVVITAQVFTNSAGPLFAASILADYVIPSALFKTSSPSPWQASDTFLASAVGIYVNTQTKHTVRIERRGDTLVLNPDPVRQLGPAPPPIVLTATGPKQYQGLWSGVGPIVVSVDTDHSGSVVGGKVNLMLRERTYQKLAN